MRNDSMSAPSLERELIRILRRLSGGTRLLLMADGDYRVDSGGEAKQARIEAAMINELRGRDLIEGPVSEPVLSEPGRAFLRRALANGDFRAQHGELAPAMMSEDDGTSRQIKVDLRESPLAWLRRRGRDGRQ